MKTKKIPSSSPQVDAKRSSSSSFKVDLSFDRWPLLPKQTIPRSMGARERGGMSREGEVCKEGCLRWDFCENFRGFMGFDLCL